MKNLIKGTLLVVSLWWALPRGQAQSVSNSAYNVFGLGTLEQTGMVAYEGMGYASIGARPSDRVNLKNPAALNSIRGRGFTQIFDVGITYSHLFQQSVNETAVGSFGGLHDLNYWFRTSPKLAWSVGIAKFSEATYDILDQSGSEDESNVQHMGKGGSSQVYLGSAYSLSPHIHLGIKTGFIFGSFRSEEMSSLTLPGSSLRVNTQRSFFTPFLEGGIQYDQQLGKNSRLTFGATYRLSSHTTLREDRLIIGNTGADNDSLTAESSSSLQIPRKIGLGLGWQSRSWELNLDYELENWAVNEAQDRYTYQDRYTTSFGAQYVKDRQSDKLINRTAFRFGGGIHSNYISVDQEHYLSQYYSLGLGIPARRGTAAINLSYQYYRSGTSEGNLIRESTNTLSLSISFKDIWFRKKAFY